MKILKTEFGKGTQSVNLEQIIESDEGLKIRLVIKSDSYQFQSKAKVEVFNVNDLSWNFVSSIHYSNMKTPEGMIYLPTVHPHKVINPDVAYPLMKDDLESLVKMAEDVLGQSFSIKAKKTKKLK